MRRVQGPLSTGTYVIIGNLNGQEASSRVYCEGTVSTLVSTTNKDDEPTKWHFEKLGHDLIRLRNKETGKAYRSSAFHEGALLDQECDFLDFIVKETETDGEYSASLAENPEYYAIPVEHGRPFMMSKEKAPWSFLHVDD